MHAKKKKLLADAVVPLCNNDSTAVIVPVSSCYRARYLAEKIRHREEPFASSVQSLKVKRKLFLHNACNTWVPAAGAALVVRSTSRRRGLPPMNVFASLAWHAWPVTRRSLRPAFPQHAEYFRLNRAVRLITLQSAAVICFDAWIRRVARWYRLQLFSRWLNERKNPHVGTDVLQRKTTIV